MRAPQLRAISMSNTIPETLKPEILPLPKMETRIQIRIMLQMLWKLASIAHTKGHGINAVIGKRKIGNETR